MAPMLSTISFLADFWLPARGSTVAPESDWLFNFVLWINVFFFLLILVLMVLFAWKYRYREGQVVGDAPKHNTALELTWTLIPTVIVLMIFYYGFKGFLDMAVAPPNPYEIVVSARTWAYSFTYPNGHIDNIMHAPAGMPVQVVLTSDDVIHGFYVPEFRLKKDIVPGRYNKLWFQADTPGTYDLYCTQYCGQGHSTMRSQVIIESPAVFKAWLEKALEGDSTGDPAVLGKKLYTTRGCVQCHTVDGTRGTGPTWKNMWGYPVTCSEGGNVPAVDEAYVRESIYYPAAKIVAGFQNVMPSFQGQLKDRDIGFLIAYMKTLSDRGNTGQIVKPVGTSRPVSPGAGPVGNIGRTSGQGEGASSPSGPQVPPTAPK